MSRQIFILVFLTSLLALLARPAAAQGRVVNIEILRGEKRKVSRPLVNNSCAATHVYEASAGPDMSWLTFVGGRSVSIPPGARRDFVFEVDGTALEAGTYSREITVSCLDCASEPNCKPLKFLKPVLLKVGWPNDELRAMAGEYVEGQVLVRFGPGSDDVPRRLITALENKYRLKLLEIIKLKSLSQTLVLFSFLDPKDTVSSLLPRLLADDDVYAVQPNFLYTAFGAQGRDYRDEQHALGQINAHRAQRYSSGGGVRVALIDSGVDDGHVNLKGRIVEKINFTDDPEYAQDLHGTMLAGIIAAAPHKGLGISGVAPRAQIISVKVLKLRAHDPAGYVGVLKQGSKDPAEYVGTASDVLQGVDFAINRKVNVVNMSFGAPNYDQSLADAVRTAFAQGIVLVSAVGNKGLERRSKDMYPAALDEVIAVSAVDVNNNHYAEGNRSRYIDVAAPGVDILSTQPGNNFYRFTGTSCAAAHVTGTVALLLGTRPNTSPGRIKTVLEETSADLPPNGRDTFFGSGLIDACKSLEALVGGGSLCN